MKQIILMICMITGIISCKTDELDGKWGDVIKFSTTELSFDAQGGTSSITSEGNWWWILPSINIDDGMFLIDRGSDGNWWLSGKTEVGGYKKLGAAEVTVDSENFITNIKGSWFTVTKETAQKITFSIQPNDTGKERTLWLRVEAGDYFSGITVNQTAH